MKTLNTTVRRAGRRIGVNEEATFDERRRMILHAAAKAFNENGIKNTSLDDVAATLGVSKPALYHYVSCKNEMIQQCLVIAAEESLQLFDDANKQPGTGLEKLRFMLKSWANFITTDFGRTIVLIRTNTLDEESQQDLRLAHRAILQRVENLVKEGIDDGSIRPCNTTVTTLAMMGMFNSLAHWHRESGELNVEEIVSELLDSLENGIAKN